jgi:hypothetical protein
MKCGATIELPASGEVLTCDLDGGHDGPVHSDQGHAWGDYTLPMVHARQPDPLP